MSCARVEPLSVVADLYEYLPILSLHQDECSGGMGMLDDVGQRLAPDAVKLGLDAWESGRRALEPFTSDGRPVGSVQARGVPGECRHEAVVESGRGQARR